MTPTRVHSSITTEDDSVVPWGRLLSPRDQDLSQCSKGADIGVFTMENGIADVQQLLPNDPSVCSVVSGPGVDVRDQWYARVAIEGSMDCCRKLNHCIGMCLISNSCIVYRGGIAAQRGWDPRNGFRCTDAPYVGRES